MSRWRFSPIRNRAVSGTSCHGGSELRALFDVAHIEEHERCHAFDQWQLGIVACRERYFSEIGFESP